jgi:hypothetical protein
LAASGYGAVSSLGSGEVRSRSGVHSVKWSPMSRPKNVKVKVVPFSERTD